MKRSIIISISLFTCLFVVGESFAQSLGAHNTNGIVRYWNCENFYEHKFAYAIFCGGDTICNGKKYEFLYYLNIPLTPNEIGMEEMWEWQDRMREQYKQRIGELRYSDDGQKIYVRQNQQEYLLYDFSVKVGDTCSVYNGFDTIAAKKTDESDMMVDLVVTKIYEKNGQKMIDLAEKSHFSDEKYRTTWIAGIGSKYGIFPIRIEDTPNNIAASTLLLCAWNIQNGVGELVYHAPNEDFSFLGSEADIITNSCESIIIADKSVDIQYNYDNSADRDNEQLPYTILGQPVTKQYKGIVIVGGKKFINL